MNSPVRNDFPGVCERDRRFARFIVEQFYSSDGIDSPVKLGGQCRNYTTFMVRRWMETGLSDEHWRKVAADSYHQVY